MDKIDIKYHRGAYSLDTLCDNSCIINEITLISGKNKTPLKSIKLGRNIFRVHDESSIYLLEQIEKRIKKYDVYVEDNTDEIEETEDSEEDVHRAYVESGCSSFDEFIERSNFPEDYE